MSGVQFSAFYINISEYLPFSSSIWSCSIKKILYLNSCNYIPYIISVCVFIIIFILAIAIGKFFQSFFNPSTHKLCWNHINDFYWIFCFVLFFIAYDAQIYVSIFFGAFMTCITILIWY